MHWVAKRNELLPKYFITKMSTSLSALKSPKAANTSPDESSIKLSDLRTKSGDPKTVRQNIKTKKVNKAAMFESIISSVFIVAKGIVGINLARTICIFQYNISKEYAHNFQFPYFDKLVDQTKHCKDC